MTTATYEKLKNELKKELLSELSNLFIRDSRDAEGEYRPEFIKKILNAAGKKGRHVKYDKKSFLKLIS